MLCGKKTLKEKIKNSGNQPEFQSSIKKRTVNQTVVCVTKVSCFMFQVTKQPETLNLKQILSYPK